MEVVRDILKVISLHEGAKKTFIMYKVYLNYRSLTNYLSKLLEVGLVKKEDSQYYLTDKGQAFLNICEEYSIDLEDLRSELNSLSEVKKKLKAMLSSK
ncbi:MAG: DUF4364 family protein [Candidatus Bathyarchaeia archaeon]